VFVLVLERSFGRECVVSSVDPSLLALVDGCSFLLRVKHSVPSSIIVAAVVVTVVALFMTALVHLNLRLGRRHSGLHLFDGLLCHLRAFSH
jgi:hypothetical protein